MASRHAQTYAHIEDIRVERKRKGFLLRLDTKHHADGEQEEGGERREQKEQQENRSRFVQEKCKRRKKRLCILCVLPPKTRLCAVRERVC